MLVDEAEIIVKGGHGGPGVVSFFPGGRKTSPSGGDGGNGGAVYAKANPSMTSLNRYVQQKEFVAPNGEKGQNFRRAGKDGKDITLEFPINTTITSQETGNSIELTKEDEIVLLVKGGKGGRGNDKFKSSINRAPREFELGEEGEAKHLKLILRFIAELGLIGLPNAGKSSLLNELTAAHVKTANYPFTTLEPNLGALEGKIIADIPGLIEGASQGKGLGIKFLKHIEKVELLLHCITAESADVEKDYLIVRHELASYNPELTKKDEVILLTKSDTISISHLEEQKKRLSKFSKPIYSVSIYDWESIEKLKEIICD